MRRAAVTSPHRAASRIGAEVLARGGCAEEACVAMGAALSVLYPHFCGIGGDAVWLTARPSGEVDAILGIGQALARAAEVDAIEVRGPGSLLGSAGAVDAWRVALEGAGPRARLGLDALLGPAIALAADGFPVTASQAFWSERRRDESAAWPGFGRAFPASLPAGDAFRQPGLADSLRRLVADGLRSFYEGALAARIADGLAAAGARLDADDLRATRATREAPYRVAYRDHLLHAPPMPTQGLATLQAMGILERLPLRDAAPGSAADLHRVVEAIKRAFVDRAGIADPRTARASPDALLSPARLDAAAATVDARRAMPWPHRFESADTVYLAAVDRDGHAASVLQSTYFDWGSGVVLGDTGIVWHNRGAAFSADPRSPNALRAGARPFHTLNPGLALRDGRLALLYGTQGADGQPQTLALLLTRLIDHGLAPADALRAPRFLLGRTFSDSTDSLKLEGDVPDAVLAELAAMGHETSRLDALSPLAGQAGVVRLHADGRIEAAHDPRSDGEAIVL